MHSEDQSLLQLDSKGRYSKLSNNPLSNSLIEVTKSNMVNMT